MKKKIVSLLLCLVLCLAVLPMAAFADETEEEIECFHESIYYEATEEGHVAHCADCGAVFIMESHNFQLCSDSDRHWIRCVDCEYVTNCGEHGNCTGEYGGEYCLYCSALREECTTWLTEHKDADGNGSCDLCGTAVVPETPHEDGWAQNDAGKWKYFENGAVVTGWKKVSGKWYYMSSEGIMQTGWQQIGGKWYYLGSDGAMQTKWQQIGGKWYYLGADGAMKTKWQQVGKKWYYLGSDGIMQTKWQQIGGKWYYLGSDGAMCTKWQQVGGKWYYLGSDGAMQTGWQEIGGVWYYLGSDGAMQTGWQKIGKKWYYLGSDGAMRTDWQKVGGEWYYLGADGAMRTDWQKIGKKWYYLGSDGAMRTGWQEIGGSWYYLDSNGIMQTGWVNTVDGRREFSESGRLIENGTAENEMFIYVCNLNPYSHKFHYPDCHSVELMKENNKLFTTATREELIEQGYEPCGICNP